MTGSNLPSVEREGALPVQVITREEIERSNLRTAAQIVERISATTSYSAFNEAQGLGGNGALGFAGVALRGLGYQFTVVLLNGRRVAPYGLAPRGTDLNAIPLAAIDRVEVLKDGASAIYGADAIGGVINFILRSEYRGFDVSGEYTTPQHVGGYAKRIRASAGAGNLATQNFNAFATIDYQNAGAVHARDRSFAARSYIPEANVDRTEVESMPANVDTPAGLRNPTGNAADAYRNPTCAPPQSAAAGDAFQCRWFGDGSTTIFDPSERLQLVGSLVWQFRPEHRFMLYTTWARNRYGFSVGPTAVSSLTTLGGLNRFRLPPDSAFYPHAFAHAVGLDGLPLDLYWRAEDLGPRTLTPTTEQWNNVASIDGTAFGWRYDAAVNYSRGDVRVDYSNGFVRESLLLPILNSGVVDPFHRNTPDVVNLLSSAAIAGDLRTATSSISTFDVRASRQVMTWPAGSLAVAIGSSVIREELAQSVDPVLASGDVLDTQSASSLAGSRNVWAAFAEATIPLARSLDADVAVRYDHYSDFGGTTNPKIALRWQPAQTLLLRASAGTGFLAPSLQGLALGTVFGLTAEPHDDPARCPFTMSSQDCARRFPIRGGGNPSLQPVTSRQWSAGAVFAPTRQWSFGVDYVSILLDDRINFFSSAQIFAQCPDGLTGRTCHLLHRGAVEPANPALPGPIVQVDQFLTNLGSKKVSAVDVEVRFVAPTRRLGEFEVVFDGTYNIEHLEQQLDGSYVELTGRYATSGGLPGTIPRWRHSVFVDWSYGPWSVTLTESYQTGAYDQFPAAHPRRIGDYDVWNLGLTYAGFPNWTLSAGIRNLFDRDPPFSNQAQNVQVGYDPSYADPHGRLYWAGVRYSFR